jgi:hypothetical protein
VLRSELAQIFALAGQTGRALEILDGIEYEKSEEPAWEIAYAYILADELDKGFEWLEEAYRHRDVRLIFMQSMPTMERPNTQPSLVEFYERIGLAQKQGPSSSTEGQDDT